MLLGAWIFSSILPGKPESCIEMIFLYCVSWGDFCLGAQQASNCWATWLHCRKTNPNSPVSSASTTLGRGRSAYPSALCTQPQNQVSLGQPPFILPLPSPTLPPFSLAITILLSVSLFLLHPLTFSPRSPNPRPSDSC